MRLITAKEQIKAALGGIDQNGGRLAWHSVNRLYHAVNDGVILSESQSDYLRGILESFANVRLAQHDDRVLTVATWVNTCKVGG